MTFWDESDSGVPSSGRRERPGGWLVIGVVLVLLLLVGGAYAATAAANGDKVPRGTTISGVDVGGLSRADARKALETAFHERADHPVTLTVGSDGSGRSVRVTPAKIGFSIDYDATLDAAGAVQSWTPARQWDFFTGGDDVDAVVQVDEHRLETRLDRLAEGLGMPPRDGKVLFSRHGVRTVDPEPGQAIDTAAARDALAEAFLTGDDSIDLDVHVAAPDIDDADVRRALKDFANPAMAAPVLLRFGANTVRLRPEQYGPALSMRPEGGVLVPHVDWSRLTSLVDEATTRGKPVDATVRLVDGKPRVVPAKPGVDYTPADVKTTFLSVLTAPEGKREAKVHAEVEPADFTTKDARDLGIKEKVSEFTTYYPHADYRNQNIGRAAELIDGTVLKPGETFSLNRTVGERTKENGFTIGYTIQGGVLVQDYGGGVSQMATTTFNAMFFAGLEDVEHKPHSFYIDRYPEGREATVAWPTVDLRFKNDTDYGVLIHAFVKPSTPSSQGEVTVQMFSTKVWDIESVTSDRYNYRPPATRVLHTANCEPNTGWSGFDVDVTRIFRKHGDDEIDHKEQFHTSYTAADTVVCKSPGR